MATKAYSDEQRRIAAASFYKMSMNVRTKRKQIKLDRDIFIIMTQVYIAHHAGETVNVAGLVEPVGKKWGTIKDKLLILQEKGLVKLDRDPDDGRSLNVIVQQPLFDFFGSILDELVDMMCMSVECIRRNGARRHRRKEDVEEFCGEIMAICRLETAVNHEKSVK